MNINSYIQVQKNRNLVPLTNAINVIEIQISRLLMYYIAVPGS